MKYVARRIILFPIIIFIMAVGFYFSLPSEKSSKKILRVMTYSSFVSVFGPGMWIKKEFEEICDCQIKWIKVPDSTLFIQRLSLKADGFKTDVVVGLDQLSLPEAATLSWKKTIVSNNVFIPQARQFLSEKFIPYDWSPMSFLSRKKMKQLKLNELLKETFKSNISLPSPRTSTIGLQFYYWIWSVFQEETEVFLKKLKTQLYGISASWSTSYALFQRGHVALSFSYLSSLFYHRQQKQMDFHFIPFEEGQPFQVELSAVSSFCTECELGSQFVKFLLEPQIQNILKEKNYMLPVIKSNKKSDLIPQLKFIQYKDLEKFLNQKEARLEKWDQIIKGR